MKNYLIDRMTINVETECWEWDLSLDQNRYGKVNLKGKMHGTHRLSWETFRGEIPKG